MNIETKSRLQTIAIVVLIGGVLSHIYTTVVYGDADGVSAPFWMSWGIGMLIAGLVSVFEIWFVSSSDYPLRRLPFLPLLAVRVVINSALILGSIFFLQFLSDRFSGTDFLGGEGFADANYLVDYGFSVVIATVVIFYFQVRTFIGGQNLRYMIMGRYHKPSLEDRIFLFCDIIGSTEAAVKLGEIGFHEYLNELFVLFDKPITRNDGLVHSYVGDAVIATWPLQADRNKNAKPLKAASEIMEVLEAAKAQIADKYGIMPGARLALHGGKVVTGETGYSKKQITYLGDTVNITARLEAKAKELDQTMLTSDIVLDRMNIPPTLNCKSVGSFLLKGAAAPMEIYSIELIANGENLHNA